MEHPVDNYIETDLETYYAICAITAHPEGEVTEQQFQVLSEEGVVETGDIEELLDRHENVLWESSGDTYRLTDYAENWREEMKAGDWSLSDAVTEYFGKTIESEINWSQYDATWP